MSHDLGKAAQHLTHAGHLVKEAYEHGGAKGAATGAIGGAAGAMTVAAIVGAPVVVPALAGAALIGLICGLGKKVFEE